jgi:hypothetical protein
LARVWFNELPNIPGFITQDPCILRWLTPLIQGIQGIQGAKSMQPPQTWALPSLAMWKKRAFWPTWQFGGAISAPNKLGI